ncbi:MAG TPA: hypothetical protein EYQ60_01415 [Myxococcales bacterium]|nr:hypothetical protein [Myxococcales bacterium]HIK84145.1 hypothetical protein [Myxococcales bacterium]
MLKPVVATIERGLVLRKLGRLGEEDRAALRNVLGEILGGWRGEGRRQRWHDDAGRARHEVRR